MRDVLTHALLGVDSNIEGYYEKAITACNPTGFSLSGNWQNRQNYTKLNESITCIHCARAMQRGHNMEEPKKNHPQEISLSFVKDLIELMENYDVWIDGNTPTGGSNGFTIHTDPQKDGASDYVVVEGHKLNPDTLRVAYNLTLMEKRNR